MRKSNRTKTVERGLLNEVVRSIGAGNAYKYDDGRNESIKSAWDYLYMTYERRTDFNVKKEADDRGYQSALDFTDKIGVTRKLLEIAVELYNDGLLLLLGEKRMHEIKKEGGLI